MNSLLVEDAQEVSATAISGTWLELFNKAIISKDPAQLGSLFSADCHWRDLLALTWDFGTTSGNPEVTGQLLQHARRSGACNFEIDPKRIEPFQAERAGEKVIEAIIRFKTATGIGTGLVRFRQQDLDPDTPQAWTLLTALQDLAGHEEETMRLGREEHPFERDWHGPNWLDKRQEHKLYKDSSPDVLVVGGGHAGLSIAATLNALSVDALVVDRMARVGDNWRKRYHALKLHNKTPSNHLPYLPFPSTWPNYIPKDKIANWLEFYVEAMEINFWTSTSFEGATRDESTGVWSAKLRLEDGSEQILHPRHIVMATSISGTPNLPEIPTLDQFQGPVLHSSQYAGGAQWKDKEVLVFGTGTSGHDIAQDLHGHGARVTMVQRSPTEVVNIEPSAQLYDGIFYGEGPAFADRDLISSSIPMGVVKESYKLLTRKAQEYDAPLHNRLKQAGFRLNLDLSGWPLKYRTRGGGYYFNVGCSDLIADGKIDLIQYDDIAAFEPEGVRLADGRMVNSELIILATGYKGPDHLVPPLFGDTVAKKVGQIWNLDESQELCNMWRSTGQPGLWFTGGSFSQCRIYSRYLALQIKAAELGLLQPA
ncbi:NAD(P)/FAD-dependent oxidoreductase [Pusillimonas sp. MFBS29]|uniref:flavin-containing monooxygenase n=1 Tax=Pusillimonas sp. MFBS29 TaxID=2886690 RepID=UPI001D128287|nr:NAD(P)/FAD-dependent oxidoreductase [Pusillimonas sp. MFBS29]